MEVSSEKFKVIANVRDVLLKLITYEIAYELCCMHFLQKIKKLDSVNMNFYSVKCCLIVCAAIESTKCLFMKNIVSKNLNINLNLIVFGTGIIVFIKFVNVLDYVTITFTATIIDFFIDFVFYCY